MSCVLGCITPPSPGSAWRRGQGGARLGEQGVLLCIPIASLGLSYARTSRSRVAAAGSPGLCPAAWAGSGPVLGFSAQVLRRRRGLQLQVLQALASLPPAELKPWIPPSHELGSGAKGDSWPSFPSRAKLKSGCERGEEPGCGSECAPCAPPDHKIGFPEIAC